MAAQLGICMVHVDREWNDGNAGSRNTTALIPSSAFLLETERFAHRSALYSFSGEMRSVRGLCDGLIFEAGDLAKHPHEAVEADANLLKRLSAKGRVAHAP